MGNWGGMINLDDDNSQGSSEADSMSATLEDAAMLRRRTEGFAQMLDASSEQSICFVTHKAYLRELERGLLGRPSATEFGNCEVRVYSIALLGDGAMVANLISCKGEACNILQHKLACPNAGSENGALSQTSTSCTKSLSTYEIRDL